MKFELKKLTPAGIERALGKVERYRLLNEPEEAESICRDVLAVDPGNQEALVSLILALTDQFTRGSGRAARDAAGQARELLARLDGAYEQAYYAGIIEERKGASLLARDKPGSGPIAYDRYRKAMECYEEAEALRPEGDDDALVRWNTCARVIERAGLEAAPATRQRTMLE